MTDAHKLAQAVTIVVEGLTNINAIPFRSFRLGMTLGSANPRLITIAEAVSYTHLRGPRDGLLSRMPSSA